ncbi:MAG TPA: hypothetical protein VGS03_21015 [Candidatus Polarisedimenticolia bacterium]|nr:hypothetical protein [Candidatus Polarisedimenticolia bacterium]
MSLLPKSVSRILIAAIVVECMVLGTIQLRRWLDKGEPGHATDGSGSDGTATQAPGRTTSAPATSAPGTGGRTASGPGSSMPGAAAAAEPSAGVAGNAAGTPGSAPLAAAPRTTQEDNRAGGAALPGMAAADRASAAGGSGNASAGSASAPAEMFRPPAAGQGLAPAGAAPGTSPSPLSGAAAPGPDGFVVGSQPVHVPGTPAQGSPPAGGDGHTTASPKPADESPGDDPDTDDDDPDGDDATADNTPPVLDGLRFDPAQVEGGSITTLTVQASDARSGIKTLWGEVRSPNRSASLSFGSANPGPGPVYLFPIALPASAQTGTWYVAWISMTDGAGNTRLIQAASAAAAPPGGTFAAFSSQSDSTPPEVVQVWFDRSAVSPGEKNTIAVQTRDDLSGVASVTGACQSPSKSALIWFNAVLSADGTAWVGDITLPATADCGEWIVQQLAVKDGAGNTALLHSDAPVLARAGFGVSSGSGCDFTAPTLDAFDLSLAVIPSGTGGRIGVTARVSDEGSGAVGMTGWFEGPPSPGGQAPKNYFSCSPDPGNPGVWTGALDVPPAAARGTWRVGSIRLEDKARNVRSYGSADPVVSGRVFQVQ